MALEFKGGIRVDGLGIGALKIIPAKVSKDIIYTIPEGFLISVSVGDAVSHDDYIAVHPDGSVFLSHVSGTVTDIVKNRVYIENDGTPAEELYPIASNIRSLEKKEIIDHIRLSGLFTEGGIPLWRLLDYHFGKCESLIINAAETNPGISCKHAVLRVYPEKVIGGIKILMRCLSLAKASLVMTEHMQSEASEIRSKLEQKRLIDIYGISSKYPAENDRVLFNALTGSVSEPSARNALILSVHDCIRVFDLFSCGRYQAVKTLTVHNQNINVPLGTPISSIAKIYSLKVPSAHVAYLGGLIGSRMATENDSVHEGSEGVFYTERTAPPKEHECIGCGRCHIHCPIGLMPRKILDAIRGNKKRRLTWYQVNACVQCGACSAVCPSFIMPHAKIAAYLNQDPAVAEPVAPTEPVTNEAVVEVQVDVPEISDPSNETMDIGTIETEQKEEQQSEFSDVDVIGSIDELSEEVAE